MVEKDKPTAFEAPPIDQRRKPPRPPNPQPSTVEQRDKAITSLCNTAKAILIDWARWKGIRE